MVSQQFQPLFIFIVFLFQQPKWIWIYFYVSSTFPHICFHHCCFVVFKNNIGTLLKVHWELHTHWVVATSDPAFLAIFAQVTIVLWNETRVASDTMQILEVRPGRVRGRVGSVTGNCVVQHCPSLLYSNCYVKIFGINSSCDWRWTMPAPHKYHHQPYRPYPVKPCVYLYCTWIKIFPPIFKSQILDSWFFKDE